MNMPWVRRSVVLAAVIPVALAAGLLIAGGDREPRDARFTPADNNLADALAKQGKLEEAAHYYKR